MQNTRLTILTNTSIARVERWFGNPWRRTSLYIISPLFGSFMASFASTVLGAAAIWDPYAAGTLVIITELINRAVYNRPRQSGENTSPPRSLFLECLNLFKIGFLYGMILEALKLGS